MENSNEEILEELSLNQKQEASNGSSIANDTDYHVIRHAPKSAAAVEYLKDVQGKNHPLNTFYVNGQKPNLENGTGVKSVQMIPYSSTFSLSNNPYAIELDSDLGDSITSGAIGPYATSLGSNASAQGENSLASGNFVIAKGAVSHAEGENSVSLGNFSHAEGYACTASGQASHAEGYHTKATGDYQHVCGVLNAEDKNALFIVGNGQGENKKNAFEVLSDGSASVQKKLTVGEGLSVTSGTNTLSGLTRIAWDSSSGFDTSKSNFPNVIGGNGPNANDSLSWETNPYNIIGWSGLSTYKAGGVVAGYIGKVPYDMLHDLDKRPGTTCSGKHWLYSGNKWSYVDAKWESLYNNINHFSYVTLSPELAEHLTNDNPEIITAVSNEATYYNRVTLLFTTHDANALGQVGGRLTSYRIEIYCNTEDAPDEWGWYQLADCEDVSHSMNQLHFAIPGQLKKVTRTAASDTYGTVAKEATDIHDVKGVRVIIRGFSDTIYFSGIHLLNWISGETTASCLGAMQLVSPTAYETLTVSKVNSKDSSKADTLKLSGDGTITPSGGTLTVSSTVKATTFTSTASSGKAAFSTASGNFSTTSGTMSAASFNATSDRRLKENISDYTCSKSILDLPIKKFDFINGSKNQIGCIAQDLQEICPEIVSENSDGYLSIQESKIVYLLLDEVKRLRKEVDELKGGK